LKETIFLYESREGQQRGKGYLMVSPVLHRVSLIVLQHLLFWHYLSMKSTYV